MSEIKRSLTELIGNTPILELVNLENKYQLSACLAVKLESMNPAGSVKDRAALRMLLDAEREGKLKVGGTIIEPTSGNTGIGLAACAVPRGYRVILTMPDTMSVERRNLLKAYGAQVVLTEGALGMTGAINKAKELAETIPGAFIPSQFDNPSNAAAHYDTTGPEIFRQTDGEVDLFVSAVGTGGTLTGTGRYLKEQKPSVKVIAVEPKDSPVLSGGESGAHKIQGIGAGFIPSVLDTAIYDEVIAVTSEESFEAARELAGCEGLLVGISSGAALAAALKVAQRGENAGKLIVALLPDT
ncbi:MAG: cysteine synthase A, partial [Clostridia bacterium]|nr:cysteine synthase A [Clostridia bacterium]